MACRVRHLEEKVSSVVGTEGFHAPEMWDEKPYTSKADIFSLGVTYMIILMHQDSLRKINDILGEANTLCGCSPACDLTMTLLDYDHVTFPQR